MVPPMAGTLPSPWMRYHVLFMVAGRPTPHYFSNLEADDDDQARRLVSEKWPGEDDLWLVRVDGDAAGAGAGPVEGIKDGSANTPVLRRVRRRRQPVQHGRPAEPAE